MHQVFFSYKESGRRLATDLAQGLEAAGYIEYCGEPIAQREAPLSIQSGQVTREAMRASEEDKNIIPNRGHAYLLLNQPDKSRQCSLANRGEQVNGDLFLDLPRRLGYHRAEMAAVEQRMGK